MGEPRGLYAKYMVTKIGDIGNDKPLTDVFVLRPAQDAAARRALAAYAEATANADLGRDLWRWLYMLEQQP